jgi:hypothetical protein
MLKLLLTRDGASYRLQDAEVKLALGHNRENGERVATT